MTKPLSFHFQDGEINYTLNIYSSYLLYSNKGFAWGDMSNEMLNIGQFQFTQRKIIQWVILCKLGHKHQGKWVLLMCWQDFRTQYSSGSPVCGCAVTPSIREGTPNTPHSNALCLLLKTKVKITQYFLNVICKVWLDSNYLLNWHS